MVSDVSSNYGEADLLPYFPSFKSTVHFNICHIRVLVIIILVEAFFVGIWIYHFYSFNDISSFAYINLVCIFFGLGIFGVTYFGVEVSDTSLYCYYRILRLLSVLPLLFWVIQIITLIIEAFYYSVKTLTSTGLKFMLIQGGICGMNTVICIINKEFLLWKREELELPTFRSDSIIAIYS